MSQDNKPIGWWLRHVDGLIEENFDRVLAMEGITRRHWQLLNAVAAGDPPEVVLAPFLPADPGPVVARLQDDLRALGWLGTGGLTPDGVTAAARIGASVAGYRGRVTAGVSAEEYRLVLDTLRRIADNLTCPA